MSQNHEVFGKIDVTLNGCTAEEADAIMRRMGVMDMKSAWDPVSPLYRHYRDAYRDGTTVPHRICFEGSPDVFLCDCLVTRFEISIDPENGDDMYEVTLQLAGPLTKTMEPPPLAQDQ